MARIRTIKPEFWTHEDLSALPEATHILAAALLNHADDEGYFNANPGLVRAACTPLREPSVSIQDSLSALTKIGYLTLGIGSDGKRYGRILKFDQHQVVNRPTPSKIKALQPVWESSESTHGNISEASSLERKGKEQGKEGNGTSPPAGGDSDLLGKSSASEAPLADRFEEFWTAYPNKTGKKPCREKWRSRRLDAQADTIIADVTRKAAEDDRWVNGFVPNPETYLNQDRWNDPVQPRRANGRGPAPLPEPERPRTARLLGGDRP